LTVLDFKNRFLSNPINTKSRKPGLNQKCLISMNGDLIQTLHPEAGKKNKRISSAKYNLIKVHLLTLLTESELTHTELMEKLYASLHDNFDGGVQWYGETVKLDLEARHLIERTKTKPEKYRLKNNEPIVTVEDKII